ncbi:MAG TPA: winged helix-turn-helix transcriptional regulator [Solirubrobacterales bacterium]|nr:winged helix-turn-helix transcriptional regulator [Solirubrobacterales bacterium]
MAKNDEVCVAGATIAEILRLLGSGATGEILLALGAGPARTKELVERVPGYTPRSIYRYTGKLADLEIIERNVEKGPPSKVTHTLTDSCGQELLELVERFADASLERLPDGRIDPVDWAGLNLLADMWETAMIDALSCEPVSPGDLGRGHPDLSYHQVARRARLFQAAGLIAEAGEPGGRQLALTEKARRAMALVIGIGRWRHHHVIAEDEEGMTAAEMATVLRTALPLASVGEHQGKSLRMDVRPAEGDAGQEFSVWAEIQQEGVFTCVAPIESVDGWAAGRVSDWIPALLDADRSQLEIGGREDVAPACIEQLHEILWRRPAPDLVSA